MATVSYLVYHDTLIQNAKDITKSESYFIIIFDKSLQQTGSGFFNCKLQ